MKFDGRDAPYPDRRLPDLVADQARLHPDAVAVRQWDTAVSYRRLCGAAAVLAEDLRVRGVGPDSLVGVCVNRTPSVAAALLGVLWTGAGYVPLDQSLPAGRIATIAREAGLSTVVCDQSGATRLTEADLADVVEFVPIPPWTAPAPAEPPSCPAAAESVAYVMFTSGSTGRPKGVMIPHQALTEFVTTNRALMGLGPGVVSLSMASFGFDVSVMDLLAPLAAGATVAMGSTADRGEPVRFERFCAAHRVDVAFIAPALLPLLDPDTMPELRLVQTGAEAPGPEQVERWTADGRTFINLYGPTEATVSVTGIEVSGRWTEPLPIGRELPNRRTYVVDPSLRVLGVDEPGELLVGGPGLALGYLHDPVLTARRFIADPFSGSPGERLYRTGDLVSRGADGAIRFLGRIDRQVKIRGQRVEIGEVEAVLRGHPGVGHAAVAAVPGSSGLELIAFVTPAPGGEPAGTAELRAHCAERLLAAMVPNRVYPVGTIPLTATGKVDLDRLISEAAGATDPAARPVEPVDPPVTDTERLVAAIWAELLELPVGSVGRDDDFFDAGGHSIIAMRLVTAIRARSRRDVAIEDVLTARTVRAVAAAVADAALVADTPPVRGRAPALSPAQRRLWFLDRFSPAAVAAYNITFAERLRGRLDLAALGAAVDAVAARQEVLRWRVEEVDGAPRAVVDPPGPMPLPVVDLRDVAPEAAARAVAEQLSAEAARPFDLATDRLWRTTVFRLADDEHVLCVSAHHAVFDGWSQALLYADLAAAYARALTGGPATLPALPAGYADYVAWRSDRQRQRAASDLDWWVSHVEGAPAVLDLPTSRSRPAEQTFTGAHLRCRLDHETTSAVTRLARELGATAPAVLLAALGVVAARLTGQRDLIVGSPTVDRREADFEPLIGFFIEIAPLRLRPAAGATFAELVRQARDELLAALAHPEAPLDRIVAELGLGGRLDRPPLVQVLFNMFNFTAPELDLVGAVAEPVPVDPPGSPFDLTVYGIERAGRLTVELVYNPDLFDRDRMAAVLDALRTVLASGVADRDRTAAELGAELVVPPGAVPGLAEIPRAVRRPAIPAAGSDAAPATDTERLVAGVWQEVLGHPVGVRRSFFDAGGSSLLIFAVRQRLGRLLGRELRVVDLFRHPTIRSLATYLDGGAAPAKDAVVARAARRGAARRDRTIPGRRRLAASEPSTDRG